MRIGIVSDTHNHMINVLRIVALLLGCNVALHGHDHRHTVEVRGQTLVINPGESAGHVKGYNAVGILDLMSLRTEILNF